MSNSISEASLFETIGRLYMVWQVTLKERDANALIANQNGEIANKRQEMIEKLTAQVKELKDAVLEL